MSYTVISFAVSPVTVRKEVDIHQVVPRLRIDPTISRYFSLLDPVTEDLLIFTEISENEKRGGKSYMLRAEITLPFSCTATATFFHACTWAGVQISGTLKGFPALIYQSFPLSILPFHFSPFPYSTLLQKNKRRDVT